MSSYEKGAQLEDGAGSTSKGREEQNPLLIFLSVLMTLIYCVSLLLPNSERWGWLPTSVGNASDAHPTDITPAGWAFTIWIIIFLWQMLWIVYVLINLCRRNDQGPVYLNPPIVTVPFILSYTVGLVAIMIWYFVWTYGIIWASFIAIIVIPITVWTCIGFLTRGLVQHVDNFQSRFDLWIFRTLLLNGLSIFGTWTALATHINLAMMIIYNFGSSIATGSIIAIIILLLLVIVYIFLDLYLWDRYLRYNVLSYPVVIWAVSAVIYKRKHEVDFEVDASFVISVVLLSIGCLAFILKAVLIIVRSVRGRQFHRA